VVELLVKQGADVNVQDGSHGTALPAASFGGYEKVAELLAPTSTHKVEAMAPRCRQHHSEATRRWPSCLRRRQCARWKVRHRAAGSVSRRPRERAVGQTGRQRQCARWSVRHRAAGSIIWRLREGSRAAGQARRRRQRARWKRYRQHHSEATRWSSCWSSRAPTSTRKVEVTAPRCRQRHSEATRRWPSCWCRRQRARWKPWHRVAGSVIRRLREGGRAAGADVNVQGRSHSTALPAASFGGYEKAAELLAPTSTRKMESTAPRCRQSSCWSNRAPTSTRKVEALPAASFGGHEVVEVLVKQGRRRQGARWKPRHRAAGSSHEKVELLVKQGADINA